MIIGHLPAGYLLGRSMSRLRLAEGSRRRDLVAASMMGAIFPDLDMIYFHLVDHGRTHHHLYWPHLPVFWFVLSVVLLAGGMLSRKLRPAPILWFFILGACSHLVLDSLVGDIYWAMPFSHEPFSLFKVQARYSPWYLNFVLHWVFALEIVLTACAAAVACADLRRFRSRLYPRHL